jgi:hypothetical protein
VLKPLLISSAAPHRAAEDVRVLGDDTVISEVRAIASHLHDVADAVYHHDVATRPDATVTRLADIANTTEEN